MHEGNQLDLYSTRWNLMARMIKHKRNTYDLLDLLGDIGGIVEVLLICFVFVMDPISHFSFLNKAGHKLFLAKTKDNHLFEHKHHHTDVVEEAKKVSAEESKKIPPKVFEELNCHRNIHIRTSDKIKIYLTMLLGRCYCTCFDALCCFKRRKKLLKLYNTIEEHINNEMDITQIMKTLRNLNIILETSLMT